MIADLNKRIKDLDDRARFLKAVAIDGTIILYDRDKGRMMQMDTVAPAMAALNLPIDLLKKIQVAAFSESKYQKLVEKIRLLQEEKQNVVDTLPESMWYSDLVEFEVQYDKYYK